MVKCSKCNKNISSWMDYEHYVNDKAGKKITLCDKCFNYFNKKTKSFNYKLKEYELKKKDPVTAAVLTFLFLGAGYIYINKWGTFFLSAIAIIFLVFIQDSNQITWSLLLNLANAIGCYKETNTYNELLRTELKI